MNYDLLSCKDKSKAYRQHLAGILAVALVFDYALSVAAKMAALRADTIFATEQVED